MQLASGGNMLNFGWWKDGICDPLTAQQSLCSLVGDTAEFHSAKKLLDIGSGLGAPAEYWKSANSSLEICCVNINRSQLSASRGCSSTSAVSETFLVNANSISLPFSDHSADRIVALESAHHFRPLSDFVVECRRVLKPGGILVIAMPVTTSRMGTLAKFFRLGILSFTWSSEHYSLDHVKSAVAGSGLRVSSTRLIGHQVYEPLADYYVSRRKAIRERILKEYSPFLESVLYKSVVKMREASRKGIIDYLIIKAS